MGRIGELQVVDPVLTNLARGYTNAQMMGKTLFPFVAVTKEQNKIPLFSKESFKAINTLRAIRAKSNVMDPEGIDSVECGLEEHDISYPIDMREIRASKNVINLESYGVRAASAIIALAHEIGCAELAQNASNYGASNKKTLTGQGQFSDYAHSDPVAVIPAAKEAVRGQIGRKPNTALMGAAAYITLASHPQLLERIKYSQLGVVTVELMQTIFGISKIVVGEAVSMNKKGVISDVWGDNIILAYVPGVDDGQEPSIYEPAYGYSLRAEDYPKAGPWMSEDNKVENINVTDLIKPHIVGADAGYLIADTNAAAA